MERVSSYGVKGTETCATLVNRLYTPGKRGVVVLHGRGGRSHSWVTAPVAAIDALAGAGYPVIIPDLGGDLWDAGVAQQRVTDAVTYLQGTLGAKSGTVLLFGYSMGSLTAVNWARANPTQAAAVAVAAPISLADIHNGDRSGYAAEIEAAYGGAAAYAAAASAHDPRQNGTLATPCKVWSSDADTLVTSAEAASYVSALGASQVQLSGVSHANIPDAVDPDALLGFFRNYA